MMPPYRIITNGLSFKVQFRPWWWPLWLTLNPTFSYREDAQAAIDRERAITPWRVV